MREINLKFSERESPHWILSSLGASVLEVILRTHALASQDEYLLFAQGLWGKFCDFAPISWFNLTSGQGGPKMRVKRFSNEAGHKLCFAKLDAAQHCFLLEKCRGRYRLYQMYVKDRVEADKGYYSPKVGALWVACQKRPRRPGRTEGG